MNTSAPVTATIRIAAAPDEVLPYLVGPDLLAQWIGSAVGLEPESGGCFGLDLAGTSVRGKYLAVEPPSRVVFTWGIPDDATLPAGSTTVEITLRADGDETVVELVHRDLPLAWRAPHQAGWISHLAALVPAAARSA